MVVVLSFAAFAAVLGVVEVLHRRWDVPSEDARRLAHIGSSVVAAVLPLALGWTGIVLLGATFTVLMALSLRHQLLRSVHGVARRTWGEVLFPAGVTLLAATTPPTALFVFGTLVMGFGDGAAGLVGQHLGRHRYAIGAAHKTVEGSAAFVVVTWTIGIVVVAATGSGGVDGRALVTTALTGVILAAVEAVLPWGLDNLVLPPAAALTFWALCQPSLA